MNRFERAPSPIGPLVGRLFNYIDVLALCILLCGEKKHRERSSRDCRLRSKGPLAVRALSIGVYSLGRVNK